MLPAAALHADGGVSLPTAAEASVTSGRGGGPDTRRIAFVLDCTGSMRHQLTNLLSALDEVVGVLQVSCSSTLQVGVLAYLDYCDPWVTRWSGWHNTTGPLADFLEQLRADGGGDEPEAAKTALKEVIGLCGGPAAAVATASDACDGAEATAAGRTVLFWYTDAPPHATPTPSKAAKDAGKSNPCKELQLFKTKGWDHDWIALCREAAAARITAYPVFKRRPGSDTTTYFGVLADVTGGLMVDLGAADPTTQAFGAGTVSLILSLMRCEGVTLPDRVRAMPAPRDAVLPQLEADLLVSPPQRDGVPLVPGSLPHLIETPSLAPAARFTSDRAYKCAVYRAFLGLHARSLTYNPLFAALWRAICLDRKDERRQALLDKFSSEVKGLSSETERAAVQAFLDLSYDQSDVVARIVGACEQPLPAVIIPLAAATLGTGDSTAMTGMSAQAAMDMFRSFRTSALQRLSTTVTSMVVRSTSLGPTGGDDGGGGGGGEAPRAVPLALRGREFFSVLLHLATPGLVLSRRASVVLALVAMYVRAAPLLAKAREFVHEVRGKWIDWDLPVNFSLCFVKFVLKVHEAELSTGGEAVLTPQEEKVLRHMRAVGGLKVNEHTVLTVRLPFGGSKDPRPDTRLECVRCHGMRSFTMVDAEGVCGMCHWDEEEREWLAAGKGLPHGRDASSAPHAQFVSKLPDGRSYWCECRSCAAHYAVERVELLNVPPKCYFCRYHSTPAPTARCAVCTNAFVCALAAPPAPVLAALAPAAAAAAVVAGQWVCPPCAAGEAGVDKEAEVNGRQYLEQVDGPHFLQPLGLTSKALFASSPWEIGQAVCPRDSFHEGDEEGEGDPATPAAAAPPPVEAAALPVEGTAAAEEEEEKEKGLLPEARLGGKVVLNLAELRAKVQGWVNAGVGELGTCAMCFDDVRTDQLRSACGRRNCRTPVCNGCLGRWYGELVPGCVLPLAQLCCAFCKLRPAPATLRPFNREALALHVPAEVLGEAGQLSHYAWCAACYTAKPIAARECAAAAPTVQDWRCDECCAAGRGRPAVGGAGADAGAGAAAAPRECPSCGVMVEKVSGCNHIACTACSAHWCYECGFCAEEAGAVYEHMYEQHGGYYGEEGVDE